MVSERQWQRAFNHDNKTVGEIDRESSRQVGVAQLEDQREAPKSVQTGSVGEC